MASTGSMACGPFDIVIENEREVGIIMGTIVASVYILISDAQLKLAEMR